MRRITATRSPCTKRTTLTAFALFLSGRSGDNLVLARELAYHRHHDLLRRRARRPRAEGRAVPLKGWVRTRRDSKAGISFVHVSDGSCFHPVQVVAPNTLPNYAERGAAPHRRLRGRGDRHDRAVARQGPAVRDAGERDQGRRLGRRSRHLPDPAQAAHARVPARGRAPAAAHQRDRRRRRACATRSRRRSTASSTSDGFVWVNTPIITASDAEGAGALFRVSTLDLANLPRTPDGKVDFAQDFFGARGVPHRVAASSTSRPTAWRCRRSTRSARRSAPRTRTPAGTSPSSG